MSDFISLEVSKRDLIGKRVKQLRREGRIPAVLYGPDVEPLSLAADWRELRQVLLDAGGTQIIELNIEGDKVPTLARVVQRDPIRGDILHVDFYRVAMDRLISADVPVMLVGENPLAEAGTAILVHSLNSLSVEALPASLPPHIEVDVARLTEIGDQLLAGDLEMPEGVVLLTDPEEFVIKLDYPVMPEEEEEEDELEELLVEESAEPEVITARKEKEEDETD